MSVLKKSELMEKLKTILGDKTDDETIVFIEDVSDTLDAGNSEDWKQKYEENDKMWREKYTKRFFDGNDVEDDGKENDVEEVEKETEKEEAKPLTFENLFKGENE